MLRLDSSTERQAFIDQNDCFLLDCDGVIWVGSTLIPNVKETIMALKALGKQIIFVTNNASKSRATYQERFASMGISADVREIFGSAFATATHMQHIIPADKKVFVVGMKGLTEELDACNVNWTGAHVLIA